MPLTRKPAIEMFHNKISHSPSQPRRFLAEGRGTGWGHWRPSLVGASNCVGCTRGAVGNFWGFAAGVSGIPGVTAVNGAKGVSGAAGVSGVASVAGGPHAASVASDPLPRLPGVPWVWRVPWKLKMPQVKGGATGSKEADVSQVSIVPCVCWSSGMR